MAAVQDIFGVEDENVFKSASRVAGGVGISARGRAWHKMPRGGGVAGGGKNQSRKGGVSKKENLKIFLREEKVNFCEWDS